MISLTIEDRANESLKTIVSLAGGIVAMGFPASSGRLARLELVIGLYTPVVLEVLVNPSDPSGMIFKFPELRPNTKELRELQYLEFIDRFSLEDVAQELSKRYKYLVKLDQDARDNQAAISDPVMAAKVLRRDFPDFESRIRMSTEYGLCFVIDGYRYEDLRKVLASLTWVQV